MSQTAPQKRSILKYVIGLLVILGVIVFIISSSLSENLQFFKTPSEYIAQRESLQNRVFRLGGIVEVGSKHFDRTSLELSFRISDGVTSLPVRYRGAPPDLFREGYGVTVEGKFEGNVFVGQQLLVKHSEEYRAPKPGERLSDGELTRSLEDVR